MKLKVGVIGCGGIATGRHIPAYINNPNTDLVAVYDSSVEKGEKIEEEYGVKAYKNLSEMLMHPGLEAVSVCTPEMTHRDIVIEALKSGKHVLCEKPMALDSKQAEEMLKVAKKTKRILMISYNQRIYEPHWKAKELLKQDIIGKPIAFRSFLSHGGPEIPFMERTGRSDFFDKNGGNGGVLLSVGCHRIDLIPWMFETQITEIMTFATVLDKKKSNGIPIDNEDTAMLLLKCQNGLSGMLYTSWCVYGCNDRETHIFGTEGVMKLFEDPWSIAVYKKNGEKIFYDLKKWAARGSEGATEIINRFISCVLEKKTPFVTPEEGVQCMKVLDAARRSAKTGTWEKVY